MEKIKNLIPFITAVRDKSNVKGLTHDFYNYPARFSPIFVREAIKTFSKPGDWIVDPFVGGGTTMVEARLLNRHCIGLDVSSLATFITKTKVTLLNLTEIDNINNWSLEVISDLDCYFSLTIPSPWNEGGYHRNVSGRSTWPIRNMIEDFLNRLENSSLSIKEKNFLRCSILKTGQWALDNKTVIPSATNFRLKLSQNIIQMGKGAADYNNMNESKNIKSFCINKPSYEIDKIKILKRLKSPSLILTSPPYPGVHVVYHRWQIQGRKETPAPFWIANSLDGHGLAHYAMGGRNQKGLENYYANILKTFSSIKKICSNDTLVVQMLAFSKISWQLPKYLNTMKLAGFQEVHFTNDRIWRDVPNRKWYADKKGKTDSANEVVLFHKLLS